MAQPKLLLEGKYEILSKIREGGMGTIYRVRHRLLDEVRVVKVMQPHVVADADLKRRFLEEAKTAIRLKHPNVCTIHDYAVDEDGTAYLVMEYIDGINLADFLKSRGCPPLALTVEIAHQALLALGYLHRKGVVHRDIAPDNLMLTRDEERRPFIKLIDLGIAKAADRPGDMTATGVFLGKLKYASPEQYGTLPPGEKLDGRSDLYGMGIVLYELLTGMRPFRGESPAELLRAHLFTPPIPFSESDPEGKAPPALRAVVLHALEKKREDRYASAEDFDREILPLRDEYASPTELAAAISSLAVPLVPSHASENVTPSAQDRLDRHFGPQTTPSPSASPLTMAVPPPEDAAAPTVALPAEPPAGAGGAAEADRAGPSRETAPVEATMIHPALAAERASETGAGRAGAPAPARPAAPPPEPPRAKTAARAAGAPAGSPRAPAPGPSPTPAAPRRPEKAPAPAAPRRSRTRLAAAALGAGAVLALVVWHPWTRRAASVEGETAAATSAGTAPAAQPTPQPTAPPAPSPAPTAAPTSAAPPASAPASGPAEEPRRVDRSVENARAAAELARRDADRAGAREIAPSTYQRGIRELNQAEQLSKSGAGADAKRLFDSSSRLLGRAASVAREETARREEAARRPAPTPVQVAQLPTAIPRATAAPLLPTAVPEIPTAPPRLEPTRVPTERPAPTAAARTNAAEERKIRETIRKYSLAWSTKDAKLFGEVYPSGLGTFKEAFRALSSQVVNIEISSVEIDGGGSAAQVIGNEITVATPRAGTEQRSNLDVTFHLQKTGDRWIIVRRNARTG